MYSDYGRDLDAVVLETRALLHVPGESAGVDTVLSFDITDPAAVQLCFRSSGQSIDWVLARDLLADGLYTMSGLGDVVVWPGPDCSAEVCNLRLSSPTGVAVFELPAQHVRVFLDRTYDLVPRHREIYDGAFDAELEALLDGQV